MANMNEIDDKSSERLQRRQCRRRFHNCITCTFLGLSFYVLSLIHKNNQRSLLSSSSTDQWKIKRAAIITNQQNVVNRLNENRRRGGGGGNNNNNNDDEFDNNMKLSASNPHKWINPRILPILPGEKDGEMKTVLNDALAKIRRVGVRFNSFRLKYIDEDLEFKEWEKDADTDSDSGNSQPRVDYRKIKYVYPDLLMSPPEEGGYPKMQPLEKLLEIWPQDDLDLENNVNDEPMEEVLLHFDYSNITQRNAAVKFRNMEIPFKVYNLPELTIASKKWTDKYVSRGFTYSHSSTHAAVQGHCQQSDNNYFAFFRNTNWDVPTMGPPPTMDNDWTFAQYARHARYADKTSLPFYKKHYYWQAGVPPEEKYARDNDKSFISLDLPSFSSTTNTFFSFHVDEQKGIQCRFGERGVTAATHYDGGRNMVAMITGAKRYILSPPTSCSQLGIVNQRQHPVFRHSLLNFAHISLLANKTKSKGMSSKERKWLEVARSAPSLSTVLKEGEVLYIPSHWFHYITSLQKSGQCNVRSGHDTGGTEEFGGFLDVKRCVGNDNIM